MGKKKETPTKMTAPPASSDAVRKSMQGNKRRDTKPELTVRRMLRELVIPAIGSIGRKRQGIPT